MVGVSMAVHGGAWNIPDALWPAHESGCRKAYDLGLELLQTGGSALDAVVAAIGYLEDDPVFDAGYGSFLNELGEVELDAGLMEGRHLKSGAVLGVSRVKNPIELALHVLKHTDHCLFTGEGAHQLVKNSGVQRVDPQQHIHPRERELHRRIQAGDQEILEQAWTRQGHDTVGAIALDKHGVLAAGNSTGGTLNKAVGRVGDAALVGSGFYADNQIGAVVCTGWGEGIMRSAMAMKGLHLLESMDPHQAARKALDHLRGRVGGFGGILLMNRNGRCGLAFNTERMAYHHGDHL